jgi:ADP-ribosylglycohydrolase
VGSLVVEIAAQLPDTSVRDRLAAYGRLPQAVRLAEAAAQYGASGYVIESVPFALFAAQRVEALGFTGLLEQIILAGGDTDTNASLAGQVVGTELGLAGLPRDLVAGLPQADMVMGIASEFAAAVTGSA